jgi:branched-chain amino acid transport system ATP-binding protein
MFAPKYVENKLKFFPFIKEAVAFGDKREKVCAFVNIDFEAVGNWAERRNLPYAGYTDLASKPEVLELVRECVEKVNADLSADAMLAGSQISRFLVLHKELDADDGEMTRTRKVKRGYISDKYQVLVDALYGGKKEQFIETAVKFEDGRSGSVSATLPIVDAKTYPVDEEGRVMADKQDRRGHPRHPEHQPALRRGEGADRHQLQRARARGARHHRPQRRRQEQHAQLHQRRVHAAGRQHHLPRQDLLHMNSRQVAEMGFARTFQNLALFKGMSVLDNIMTGRNLKMKTNLFQQAFRWGAARARRTEHREFVEKIIDFLEIQAYRKTPVGRLPYGLQKRVDLGRALAMEPQVLLLDEPMAGMNVEEKQDMCRFVLDVNEEFGTTIVLIEHDMGVVMDISDRVVVLDYGKKIGDGTPEEVRANPDVISAYLGTSH